MIAKHLALAAWVKPNTMAQNVRPLFHRRLVFNSYPWVHGKLSAEVTCACPSNGGKNVMACKNVFATIWNITIIVKCHFEWESKHIFISVFKVGLFERSSERGHVIAMFGVMFGLFLRFDVTVWKVIVSLSKKGKEHEWMGKLLRGLNMLSAVISPKRSDPFSCRPSSQLQPPTPPRMYHCKWRQTLAARHERLKAPGPSFSLEAQQQCVTPRPSLWFFFSSSSSSPFTARRAQDLGVNTGSDHPYSLNDCFNSARGGGIYFMNCVWQSGFSDFIVACL